MVVERLLRTGERFARRIGFLTSVDTVLSEQAISIVALDTIWLPAAFEPRSISAGNTAVRYEPDSSTLIVGTSLPNSNGVNYVVQSALPTFDPAKLTAATDPPAPGSSRPRRPQLPAGPRPAGPGRRRNASSRAQPRRTHRRSRSRTTSATTSTYDLNVPPGQSDNAIVDFLFVSKRGYCEQFAGTLRGDGAVDRTADPGRGRVHAG